MKKRLRNDERRVILLRFLSRKLGVVARDERASRDPNHTYIKIHYTLLNKGHTKAVRGIRSLLFKSESVKFSLTESVKTYFSPLNQFNLTD